MLQIVLRVVGLIFLMYGTIMVYDARILTRKWFGFGDQNEATAGFKILGAIFCLVGAIIVFFNK